MGKIWIKCDYYHALMMDLILAIILVNLYIFICINLFIKLVIPPLFEILYIHVRKQEMGGIRVLWTLFLVMFISMVCLYVILWHFLVIPTCSFNVPFPHKTNTSTRICHIPYALSVFKITKNIKRN